MPGEDLEDRELIRRLAAGDRAALDPLLRRHAAAVLRLAQAITHDAATADDVLQDTFLAVLRHAGSFRGGPGAGSSGTASVRAWLFALARHGALKAVRPRPSSPGPVDPDAPLLHLGLAAGWGEATPEALLVREEESAVLTRALARLAPEDRELLHLRDVEGLSGEEAAGVLGLSLAAMKSRLHRARLRLVGEVRGLTRGGGRA